MWDVAAFCFVISRSSAPPANRSARVRAPAEHRDTQKFRLRRRALSAQRASDGVGQYDICEAAWRAHTAKLGFNISACPESPRGCG